MIFGNIMGHCILWEDFWDLNQLGVEHLMEILLGLRPDMALTMRLIKIIFIILGVEKILDPINSGDLMHLRSPGLFWGEIWILDIGLQLQLGLVPGSVL